MTSQENDFTASLISLDEVYNKSRTLAGKIISSSLTFDAIVAIARGGFPPARFLCDFLNIETLYSIQIKHYGSGAQKQEKAEILSENIGEISNKKILIVDDVNDTGKSLIAAGHRLESAAMVKTAVLHEKENSEFKVDFTGGKIMEWKWLIYPWAMSEDVLEFLSKGNMLDADIKSAQDYLLENYKLKIEDHILENVLEFKTSYFENGKKE